MRPIGHRVLVKPDEQPDATDSGLILPQDHDHIPVSGTVVAVGNGPARDQRIRQAAISRCLGIIDELFETFPNALEYHNALTDEIGRYKAGVEQMEAYVAVGDRVVYPQEAGLKITEDGAEYILLNEDDVAVVVADSEVAA